MTKKRNMNETEKLSRLCGFFTEQFKDEIISWDWNRWKQYKDAAEAAIKGSWFPKPIMAEIQKVPKDVWEAWAQEAYQDCCFMFRPDKDFEDLMHLVVTLEKIGFTALIGGGVITIVDEDLKALFSEKYTETEELRDKLFAGCVYVYKMYIEKDHNENELGFNRNRSDKDSKE